MSPFEHRKYSSSQIRRAGNLLKNIANLSPGESEEAFDILVNFRALHYAPLNTFQATLRDRLKKISKEAIVAQRIKRLPTILDKLQRYPGMQLDRMQDIGGIRAIVSNMSELNKLRGIYLEAKRFPHVLVENKDYISHPKPSGYRGYHLVYKYHNKRPSMQEYEGLRIEMQMRTRLQHIWATAVETFEAFEGEKFKSSQGDNSFLEFFKYVSSAFAIHEKQPILEEHSRFTRKEIDSIIEQYVKDLAILEKIKAFSLITHSISTNNNFRTGYGVLILDTQDKSVSFRPYFSTQIKEALDSYYREETRSLKEPSRQVVLVKTDSIQKLRKAYPNYFADLAEFRNHLEKLQAT